MKKWLLTSLIGALLAVGCADMPKAPWMKDVKEPIALDDGSAAEFPEAKPIQRAVAPPRPVTPDQVTEDNGSRKAEELLRELEFEQSQ